MVISTYLFFLTASSSFLASRHFLMFSGKKSGRFVLTICKGVGKVCAYIEQEVPIDGALVADLREVPTQLVVVEHLCLKLSNSELSEPWYSDDLQL